MIGSFASGAIAFIVAKNQTKNFSQLFKELQGSNSEFKLFTPNLFLGPYQDYFGTILGQIWDHFRTLIIFTYFDLWGPILTYQDLF